MIVIIRHRGMYFSQFQVRVVSNQVFRAEAAREVIHHDHGDACARMPRQTWRSPVFLNDVWVSRRSSHILLPCGSLAGANECSKPAVLAAHPSCPSISVAPRARPSRNFKVRHAVSPDHIDLALLGLNKPEENTIPSGS